MAERQGRNAGCLLGNMIRYNTLLSQRGFHTPQCKTPCCYTGGLLSADLAKLGIDLRHFLLHGFRLVLDRIRQAQLHQLLFALV